MLGPEHAQRFLTELTDSGIELGVDQVAAVRGVLTSGAHVDAAGAKLLTLVAGAGPADAQLAAVAQAVGRMYRRLRSL